MPEIVGTFLRAELRDEGADGSVKAWDGSRCHFTQECLEFAVRHLDGIEVGRIFRQVTQCRAHCFDSPAKMGGISELQKVFALAAASATVVMVHSFYDGPGLLASVHASAALKRIPVILKHSLHA